MYHTYMYVHGSSSALTLTLLCDTLTITYPSLILYTVA